VDFSSAVDPGATSETPWLASTSFDHDIITTTANGISTVLFFQDMAPTSPGNFSENCTGMASYVIFPNGSSTDCKNVSPDFTSASTAYYNQSLLFNFMPGSGSPAIHAGTAPDAEFDIMGNPFASTPSLGAYEVPPSSSCPSPTNPCDLNGDCVVNGADVQIAINQTLGISPCTNASLQGNGLCTVVDVQRVINASLPGGTCNTGQ
jgi:hypothetical protein